MLGEKIKELRKTHNISQEELAGIMGLTRSTIYKYERNERMPDLGTVTHMAEYFGVTLDYICGRKPSIKEKVAYEIVALFDRKGLTDNDVVSTGFRKLLLVASFVIDTYCSSEKR